MGCPVCGGSGRPFRSAQDLARDLDETEEHHAGKLKLMRRETVPIAGCDGCGTLWRADARVWRSAERDYRNDTYTVEHLEQLHQDEVALARRDQRWLTAHGVGPGSRLLEVACYVGGLLTFAGEQAAVATGVDLNGQLVGWCRSLGLDARCGALEELDWCDEAFDGVWILNCFDQVASPGDLLEASRRLLHPGGRLVIRTPNAAFVRAAYASASLRTRAVEHALWGIPHLCCYTVAAACTLVRRAGFIVEDVRARPSGHDTRPDERDPAWFDLTAVAC
jgi:2-polyprenyl-3-methyl-5-hydroxy-6-metoxy-1,4-benzoquinol methylase